MVIKNPRKPTGSGKIIGINPNRVRALLYHESVKCAKIFALVGMFMTCQNAYNWERNPASEIQKERIKHEKDSFDITVGGYDRRGSQCGEYN